MTNNHGYWLLVMGLWETYGIHNVGEDDYKTTKSILYRDNNHGYNFAMNMLLHDIRDRND